ncbi:MAG: MBL fold metallo-hydrolase [Candidatus Krumholzibacteriia bacterium]
MTTWQIETLTVGPLQMNAHLLTTAAAAGEPGLAVLVDPGDEPETLLRRIDAGGWRLTALLATHGHFDHVGAAATIQERWDLPLICHPGDLPLIERMPEIQAAYGFPASGLPRCEASLVDGRELAYDGAVLRVIHVPGHSPGHVMFVWEGHAVVGDCLFAGSVGRTDLPGGDHGALEKSIRERIYTLPDATIVHPGHGPDTTVGRERTGNPFVRG